MNPYETIGVPRDADEAEIKRVYRQRANSTHPDRKGGDEEAFKSLAAAYALLSDPEARAHYDRTGRAPDPQGGVSVAEQIILNVLHGSIIAKGDLGDVLGDLRLELHERLEKHQHHLETAREGEAVASEQLGRFRQRNPQAAEDNLIEGAFVQLVTNARRMQESETIAVKSHEEAIALLDNYEDTRPPAREEDLAAVFAEGMQFRGFKRGRHSTWSF